MIHQDCITSTEFDKRIQQDDEICVLAQALADEAMGAGYNLSYKKDFIRQRYMDLAKDLIKKLDKHNLIIIHKNKSEVSSDKTE